MKASLNWIKELLPNLKASAESIERKLTDVGIEVEDVVRQADAFAGIVTAEVKTLAPHPDADKLRVATVFDGEDTHTVVCGAPNVEAGQKIAFARVGATVPGPGFEIGRRKIRGVESSGMICSEAELGISDEADGIMVLSSRTRPGKDIARHLKLTDVIFEIAATPNRPDVLSHLGLARELAAIYRLPMPRPKVKLAESGEPASTRARIDIRAAPRCTHYIGRVLEGVQIGPSPAWAVRRLEAVGLRSISNVVDATNLALMELGHPLHAFDLDKLGGRRIIVRRAKDGETITTLDAVERKLDADDLVIADAAVPVALAGVMGGADSEVAEGTTNVLLEAAMFDPRTVRRSAKRHGLHTEASHRFERGADPLALELAIDRCAELILELAGGRVLPGRIEVLKREHKPKVVHIRHERASLLLGRPVDRKEVRAALTALGLKRVQRPKDEERLPRGKKKKAKKKGPPANATFFVAPSWRVDLAREEDLIEEVARMTGFDSIPTIMPPMPSEAWTAGPQESDEWRVRRALAAEGCTEAISLAFCSAGQLEAMKFDVGHAVHLANPLGEESALMRMSLLPALLKSVRLNQGQQRQDLRLFEIGRTFTWGDPPAELPEETLRAAVVLRGNRHPVNWTASEGLLDVYDLKGALVGLLRSVWVVGARWEPCQQPWLHPRSATRLESASGQVLGHLGELHPDVMDAYELEGAPVYVAELDVAALMGAGGAVSLFSRLPRFPAVGRDLSFYVKQDISSAAVLDTVRSTGAHLEDVRVFDVYEGKGLPEGCRSLAIKLTFRHQERTLTDEEVDTTQAAIMAALEGQHGAQIRSGG